MDPARAQRNDFQTCRRWHNFSKGNLDCIGISHREHIPIGTKTQLREPLSRVFITNSNLLPSAKNNFIPPNKVN